MRVAIAALGALVILLVASVAISMPKQSSSAATLCLSTNELAILSKSDDLSPAAGELQTIGTKAAVDVALAHGHSGQTVLDTHIMQMDSPVHGTRTVFLVGLSDPVYINRGDQAPCEIQVVDATTGEYLYGVELITPGGVDPAHLELTPK